MKRRTKIAIIVLPLVLILLAVCIVYFRPLRYSGSYTACTLEGDTIQVEFDVVLHRGLWNGDKLTGRILVDGREFVSVRDLVRGSNASVDVLKSNTSFQFYMPTLNLWDSFRGDEVMLILTERGQFDNFVITTINKPNEFSTTPYGSAQAETYLYFGPADSQAEAENIANVW